MPQAYALALTFKASNTLAKLMEAAASAVRAAWCQAAKINVYADYKLSELFKVDNGMILTVIQPLFVSVYKHAFTAKRFATSISLGSSPIISISSGDAPSSRDIISSPRGFGFL